TTPAQPGGARPHPAPAAKPAAKAAPAAPPAGTSPQLGKAFRLAQEVLLPIASPLGTAAIVFVISIFILLQREDLRDRLIRVFGSGDLHRTTIAMDDIGRRLSRYYLAQLAVNAGFGTTIGVGLFVIGVPSPMLWGVLAMLLRFVPYLGSPLAMLLPVALAVAVAPGWSMALWTVALFAAAELVTSQAVEPFTYGRSTGLSPFAVVVAAIFWTWAWGPIGLLLSTPLTVCLVVLGRYVKPLEFLDVLLGTRPPLSPIENFYQRLLAGDPDEVQDHAELLLRDRSLAQYYDEVAIKGLQFATADAARGVLSPEALARIRTAIGTLVHELDELPDSTAVAGADDSEAAPGEPGVDAGAPAAPEAKPVVLCIAGRGPLDDGAVEMLAQLLRRAGLDAHVLSHAAASRARIGGIDPRDVAMAVLCYLDLSTRPAHLRFLLRRLRHRLPGRPIVVGLSSISAPAAEVERLLTTVGADRTASSLRGMVDACRDLAGKAPLRALATISPDPASPTPAQAAE
ncbi:MAG: AI-2E family transporter, partial [Acetobacteraceae bacterium]